LEIEQGRHNGILLENRICELCEVRGVTVIADEYHFLLRCPVYSRERELYISHEFTKIGTYERFIALMSTDSEQQNRNKASYLVTATAKRTKCLSEINIAH